MKGLSENKAKEVVGGAKHYHWVCTVNNFWSIKYPSKSSCNKALENHWANEPSHRSSTYVTTCTGKTCN